MAVATETRTLPFSIPLLRQVTWWVLAFPLVMTVALATRNLPLLNWVHVLAGVLWTGADIFMGFIVGPVMRRLDVAQRTAVVAYLVPRTLLYFPVLAMTTGTAGWYLASWTGMLVPGSAQYPWALAALAIITLLTIQGMGIMLPNSVRMWLMLRAGAPDRERLIRLNRTNIRLSGFQGVMQVAIIFVMSHLVVGGL